MALANHQRDALVAVNGEPALTLEFDVWADGNVSMWTHLKHGDDYNAVKRQFVAIRRHLDRFIKDGDMCPFHVAENSQSRADEPEKGGE